MKKLWIVLGIIILAVALLGGWFISGLNYVVKLDEGVKESWSQVENQLQRRNDLIPNLVNTVKGYAQHESKVFTDITKLRSQWAQAKTQQDKINTANKITAALSRLLLVVENYPELKANENFLTLQAQLEGTENRIAVERRRYNQQVKIFNSYIRSVFGSIFARLRGLDKPAIYFKAAKGAKKVPQVKF